MFQTSGLKRLKIVNEYDQEMPQSQTADNPVAPRGRAAQPSRVRVSYKIAQPYCKAENTSSYLAGVATIVELFCWVPCQKFVLIIYDRIAHVISILSVHITDVYRLN